MQTQQSQNAGSLEELAKSLQFRLHKKTIVDLNESDPSVVEAIARLSAGEMISLVESMGNKDGSISNLLLYKNWIETVGVTNPDAYIIWYNLGVQYSGLGDTVNRIKCYQNALVLKPTLYQAAVNLGLSYESLGQTDAALASWEKLLQPADARTALLNNIGRLLENQKKYKEAEGKFVESLLANPKQSDVLHHLVGLRTRTCTWPIYKPNIPGVSKPDLVAATRALTLLAMSDDNEQQTAANASWIAEKMPAVQQPLSSGEFYGHSRLRIGYLSSDFCMHPIAYLVAELIETHDREAFEVYGYCSTKDDKSDVRQRLIDGFDHFVEVHTLSDEQTAHKIRADEIDILVDLNGLTLGTRLQVLRWRSAPIQMTYLGYNGPLPLPELDYIIADEFVIPPEAAPTYRPTPLYMPKCFQVNDSKLPIFSGESRADVGLPEDKFIFCSFCNTYKITEEVFESWLAILQRTENTVLWLFVDNDYARVNLQERVAEFGVAEDRIIFASRAEASKYRGRLALADLFLDTFPYNAGTTASDALRVGLPLITRSGVSFTARMAGSLLRAMDLEDCVVYDIASYVELAAQLASDPEKYAALKQRTTPEVWLRTLGDTQEFCRSFEKALQNIVLNQGSMQTRLAHG